MKDTRGGGSQAGNADVVKLIARLVIFAVFAGAGAAGAWAACARWLPLELPGEADRVLPGLRVDGQAVGPEGVRGTVEARAQALGARRVRLVVREGDAVRTVVEGTLGDLGVS